MIKIDVLFLIKYKDEKGNSREERLFKESSAIKRYRELEEQGIKAERYKLTTVISHEETKRLDPF